MLIAKLLHGCLPTEDVSTHNYQMYLRRLFRTKCDEQNRHNPFNTDIDFKFLPLRNKVETLHALCDFRLEADDVAELIKNIEADELRLEPLGYDKNGSSYWYFYGTRLYREDHPNSKPTKKEKIHSAVKSIWQVVCFTEQDWINLVQKFKNSKHYSDVLLHDILVERFLPEVPKWFELKETLQRKRLLCSKPIRASRRVNKINFEGQSELLYFEDNFKNSNRDCDKRHLTMALTGNKNKVTGRQTNNSLASATGQILIQNKNRTATVQTVDKDIYCQTDEDLQTGMYKILEYLKSHDDAWPFIDPVEEEYAPNYYTIIRRPMDLQRMEDKLDAGKYSKFSEFKTDFQLLVNNCKLYNGQDNEYTEMVDNLQQAFVKATNRFLDQSSSDEEIDFPIIPITPPVSSRGRPKTKDNNAREKDKSPIKASSKPSKTKEEIASPPSKKRKRSPVDSPKRKKKKIVQESKEVKHSSKIHKKNKKLKHAKSDSVKLKYESPDEKESDMEDKPIKDDIPKNKIKKDKKDPIEEKKSRDIKKLKKSKTRGVGRPSKKKNKSKKKHNKESEEGKSKDIQKKYSKDKLDSEDGISSRSRSPSPLLSYSEESDSEKFKLEYKDNKESVSKHPKTKWKDSSMNAEAKFDKIIGEEKDKTLSPNKLKNVQSDKSDSVLSEKDKKKSASAKEKTLMLSDTIEKLRAKSKKSKENSMRFDEIFGKPKQDKKNIEETIPNDEYEFVDDSVSKKGNQNKKSNHKIKKKFSSNDISMDALDAETEQTLKDMDKWFTESETQNIPLEKNKSKSNSEPISNFKKPEKEIKALEKGNIKKDGKDVVKRKFLRDSLKQLFNKKREMQRTIDRLQPGKSKGNLINTVNAQPTTKLPIVESTSPTLKSKEIKEDLLQEVSDTCPKLSLGTVLPTEGFGLVQQHNFNDDELKPKKPLATVSEKTETTEKEDNTQVNEITSLRSSEEDEIFERPFKACQEKATPNLSAWFKAFGAPKGPKKKNEESDETQQATTSIVSETSNVPNPQVEKSVTIKPVETEPDCPNSSAESPESNRTPRTRRTSTGSTVSDHSNFSQDMDSPRTGIDERMSSTYPLPFPSPKTAAPLSKVSPKTEDVQKSINVGFYQDMTKSSPEKSCSPQELNRPQGALPTSSSHLYPSQNSPNPLQSFNNPYSGLMNYNRDSLPYYDYKATNVLPENADYVSLSPNNSSTKSFGQPNSPYGPQNQPYNNAKHMSTNQTMPGPNSPFSYSSQSSPYSNSDLSSPYGTPQPNSPYSQQTSSPNPNQGTASSSFPMKKRFNDGKLSPTNNTKSIGITQDSNVNQNKIQKDLLTNDIENQDKQSSNNLPAHGSPMGELVNMGYSKHDDKILQNPVEDKLIIHRNEKQSDNLVPFALDKNKRMDYVDDLKNRTNDDISKNAFDKSISNKPTYLFDMPNMGFPHSMIQTNYPPSTSVQNLPGRPSEVLNMNYANTAANSNHKSLTKTDDLEAINYKQKHMQTNKPIDHIHKVQQGFTEAYNKSLQRPAVDLNESARKSAVVLNSAPDNKISIPANHNDFMGYSSRNLNIPGINLNIPQCNTNLHLLNSIPNMDNRVPPNAHIGLSLNQPSMHSRGYDIHNANNSNIGLPNQNYKFSANSPNMLDPSLRKLTNMPQSLGHFMDSECRSSPSYYEAAKTSQLQPQNAHAASISSMQTMLQHSQPMPMAYNRQQVVNNQALSQCSVIGQQESLKVTQPEPKRKSSKKKTSIVSEAADLVTAQQQGFQTYSSVKSSNPAKQDVMKQTKNPIGSAFNFGPSQPGLNLPHGLYNANESYLDEYKSNSNPYYLPHRSSSSEQDKQVAPAVNQFQYLSSPAARSGEYPYIGTAPGGHLVDSSSPIYQQYLQRHQEDLLRQQTNAQMMLNQGLISNPAYASPRYHAALGMRQTYDPMNPRPPWL